MDRDELLEVARGLIASRGARPQVKRREAVDPDEVAASVEDALDYSWEPPQLSAFRGVRHQVEGTQRHLKARRWEDALRGALGVVRGFTDGYDPAIDDDGEVASELGEAIEVAGKALPHVTGDRLQGELFDALLELWWADVGHGGIGLADGVPDLFRKHTTPKQRQRIARSVKAHVPEMDDRWGRETSALLYLELAGDTLDDDAYLDFCLQNELHVERVGRLIQLKRPKDASRAAVDVPHHRLTEAADLLVRAGSARLATEVVRARLGDRDAARFRDRYAKWLQGQAERANDLKQARSFAWERFRAEPGMETYRSLRRVARKLKTWKEDEEAVLHLIADRDKRMLLVEVHLDERRVAEALEGVKGIPRRFPRDFEVDDLKRRVADASRKRFPEEARDLYLELAERLIAGKTRTAYAQAAPLVRAASAIDARLDSRRQVDVLGRLQARHPTLPALWDELGKAGVRIRH